MVDGAIRLRIGFGETWHSPDMNGPDSGWRRRAGCVGGQKNTVIALRALPERCLVLLDEGRDPRLIGRVNLQKLDADPCTVVIAAENRSTADLAQSGQFEPQAQRPATG